MCRYRKPNGRAGYPIEFRPIALSNEAIAPYGLAKADLRQRLYAVDHNGQAYSGIDAFIAIWSLLPGYYWAARLARLPLLHAGLATVYNGVCVWVLGGGIRNRGKFTTTLRCTDR